MAALSETEGKLVDLTAKANFRALGRRFGKDTQQVATAIAAADAGELAAALRGAGRASLSVAGLGDVEVSADDVVLTETPREGWAVAREGETVALDLTLTDALVRAGLAREVVRLIQEARKASGYDVTDRVEIAWQQPASWPRRWQSMPTPWPPRSSRRQFTTASRPSTASRSH